MILGGVILSDLDHLVQVFSTVARPAALFYSFFVLRHYCTARAVASQGRLVHLLAFVLLLGSNRC